MSIDRRTREQAEARNVIRLGSPRWVEPYYAGCPATVTAVLGIPSPVVLPCGLLAGHDGRHRYSIEWGE